MAMKQRTHRAPTVLHLLARGASTCGDVTASTGWPAMVVSKTLENLKRLGYTEVANGGRGRQDTVHALTPAGRERLRELPSVDCALVKVPRPEAAAALPEDVRNSMSYRQAEYGPEKWCARCREWWPADREFFHLNRAQPGGLSVWCRACNNVQEPDRA
jgi:DNA-binding PadR family transcriptional regulator